MTQERSPTEKPQEDADGTCRYCGGYLVVHEQTINSAAQMHWDCFKEMQAEQRADRDEDWDDE